MANVISLMPSIKVTTVTLVTKDEEISVRNSMACINSVRAVRNGDDSKETKENNYYRLPNAQLPEGQTSGYRCKEGLIDNGRVLLDYDVHGDGLNFYNEKIRGHEEELNIKHAELSIGFGAHLDVPVIEGLSRKETIQWYSMKLGVEFDLACQDLARACFLVPQADVLYDTDEYYQGYSEPQKQDTSMLYAEEAAAISEELMEQFIDELSDDVELTTDVANVEDFDFDIEPTTQNSLPTTEYHREYDNDYDECQRIIDLVCKAKIDLTQEYPIWWRLGVAIWNCMGYDGVEEYERLSQFYPNYSQQETDEVYQNIAKRDYNRITLGTLVWVCKKAGLFS